MAFNDRLDETIKGLKSWMIGQRWYGDKARSSTEIRLECAERLRIAGLDGVLAIVRFSYDRGPDSRYFVPLVWPHNVDPSSGGESPPRDALSDPAFLDWLVRGFEEERSIEGQVTWRWRRLSDHFTAPDESTVAQARVVSAEQSNTSIVFSNRYIGKVFRRLQPGVNPDLELGEFLTADGRFTHSPALYGFAEASFGSETIAIAAIQQYVANVGDGWNWLLDRLRVSNGDTGDELIDAIALLGKRTGEMHVALTSDAHNDAFAPREFTHEDAHELINRIISEMEESVEGLAKRLRPDELERLHKGLGTVMGGAWSLVGASKIRVHGDFHLGQTLRTPDGDFYLIDFEGEPSRPMEQRRMKQSPLKDVAGMLRSLDYAVAMIRGTAGDKAGSDELSGWLEAASKAFLAAYREEVRNARVTIVPANETEFMASLNVLIAEKALYEVRYELNNRPDWLHIPLNGIRRLAGIPTADKA